MLKDFADKGWKVVPLKGSITRNKDGSKTTPSFPKGWNDITKDYTITTNNKLGVVLTGKKSNIIILDCDTPETWKLFRALDPDNKFIFLSKGKFKEPTGSIVYQYEPNLSRSFKFYSDEIKLECMSDGGHLYLPSEDNKSKEQFTYTGDVPTMPGIVKQLLVSWSDSQRTREELESTPYENYSLNLRDMIGELILGTPDKSVLKILTPKDFRKEKPYRENGYLHPKDVPDGRGSEYLSKVSAILGADISINAEVYESCINVINSMFKEPMSDERLKNTIIHPMLSLSSKGQDGKSIWKYDKNYKTNTVTFLSKEGDRYNVFFDKEKNEYYAVDSFNMKHKAFPKDFDLISYLSVISTETVKKDDIKKRIPLVCVEVSMNKPYGYLDDSHYNLYRVNRALGILLGLRDCRDYQEPTTILKFLESLVPEKVVRQYLLDFLKQKMTTLDYSPVVISFVGKSGAGKDIFVKLLGEIVGHDYISKPSGNEFIEKFNGWMVDKFFVQCDEYGDHFLREDQRRQALGILKTYSGSPKMQVRMMRTDGYEHVHRATFILTSNTNPFNLDSDDRRVLVINCPNKLPLQDWVIEMGGTGKVVTQMMEELPAFCQWLRDNTNELKPEEYLEPPVGVSKKASIFSGLPVPNKIVYSIEQKLWDDLMSLGKEHGVNIFRGWRTNQIYEKDMFKIYDMSCSGHANLEVFRRFLKTLSHLKKDTSEKGKKTYYYQVEGLNEWYKINGDFGLDDLETPIDNKEDDVDLVND